ncbi:MAG: YraN family protein [Bacteroidia bacterium]|nr:YraN family protein [Bacteroidia bacterium]
MVVRNYRYKKAEIDIIAQKEDWLLFVEVKTRRSSDYGEPESFVDFKKANLLFMAAEEFILSTDWHGHVRFDVIAVTLGSQPDVVHFEDAIN